jgi:hypothetical protein
MAKKKEVETNDDSMYDPCPIVDKLEGKQKGLYRLNGMCFLLEHFPELKSNCPGCQYFKEIPPNSYTCKRFYCTFDNYKV